MITPQKIYIACDHAAFEAKENLKKDFPSLEWVDLGTHSTDSVHYPEYAQLLAKKVQLDPGARGVLLCGSGIGVSIVANRFKHIRAALCRDAHDAEMSRRHNNANVLCLGARKSSSDELAVMLKTFLSTAFEGGRHEERVLLFDGKGL
jgi:ribose 5-phosphate isomerase B